MIVACTSCPAQYSVPDAKVRGKKVRVTCKHCGAGILVDATDEPQREEVRLESLEALSLPDEPQDEVTRIASRRADWSVHDEPTVIGKIPEAALEAERRFAQPTIPPPEPAAASTEPVRALPRDVPEGPLDVTEIASPQAKRQSHASLHADPAESAALTSAASAAALPAAQTAPARRASAPHAGADVKTLVSRVELEPDSELAPIARRLHGLLAALAVLALVLALMQMTR